MGKIVNGQLAQEHWEKWLTVSEKKDMIVSDEMIESG